MRISEAQKQRFEEKGFFILENIFSEAEIDNLTAEIERYVDEANQQLRAAGGKGISRPDEIVFTSFIAEKKREDPILRQTG